jgi:hypothetical protein
MGVVFSFFVLRVMLTKDLYLAFSSLGVICGESVDIKSRSIRWLDVTRGFISASSRLRPDNSRVKFSMSMDDNSGGVVVELVFWKKYGCFVVVGALKV